MIEIPFAFVAGMYAGFWMGRKWPNSDKPIYAHPARTRFATEAGKIAPMGRIQQWQTWTHNFVLFCEVVARDRRKPKNRLPSYSDFETITGLSWRHFEPYLTALEAGQVIYVERGGMYWTVGKVDRRAALPTLPYDPSSRPPRFPWTRDVRDKRDGRDSDKSEVAQ